MTTPRSIDEVLADSRDGVDRVEPAQLHSLLEGDGAHVIDVRSAITRDVEGHIPGAVVVERLVLEWRLDPASPHRMEGGPKHTDLVVVVCNGDITPRSLPASCAGSASAVPPTLPAGSVRGRPAVSPSRTGPRGTSTEPVPAPERPVERYRLRAPAPPWRMDQPEAERP